MNFDGSIRTPLDTLGVEQAIESLADVRAEAVVVAFLFSHVNPQHELAVAESIAARLPGVSITLSHEMSATAGEFERWSTAAVNAFVQPVMREYLTRLTARLADGGVDTDVLVMKSSGGVASAQAIADKCVETVLSGPAGGVRAVVQLASTSTHKNLIAADMGGTSFDVAVVTNAQAGHARETQIAGHPLRTPMLDLHTIGAGGGSIAWVDAGGALRVGPQSAGAMPGPACYGRGGELPTVTDANLILGRLVADSRLAGGMQLDLDAARRSVDTRVARPLGMTVEHAATGILRVVNTAMTAAIRKITIERGIDPRGYALCAYGGAGPLHAAELAMELGVTQAIIPQAPGVFSAEGLLGCDLREDRMQSLIVPLGTADWRAIQENMDQLETAAATFAATGYDSAWSLGLRYTGQSNEIPIAVTRDELQATELASRFAVAHDQLYGFARRDHTVEIASLWVTVTVATPPVAPPRLPQCTAPPIAVSERNVYFGGAAMIASIYRREDLLAAARILGPAIVEQDDTTTVVPPGWHGTTDDWGNLLIAKCQ